MRVEVSIHFSDRTERHSFKVEKNALMQIDLSRHVAMPAFTGTLHGPQIEVRIIDS